MPNEDQINSAGARLKRLRLDKKITLRDLAEKMELDPGNYSRVERGVFAPPAREKLDQILRFLGVDAEARREAILDQADLERGVLPSDLQQDEVLVRELPILFRAVRRGDREALDQFIEAVRQGGTKK